ncbi:MAG TPA: nicotinate-nucleotide adenylyltransferase [Anaerolineales bacterium]|nr:nicotinate-nucleotide adenylyltransferase [Anaerolineales bacterium]
MAAKKRVGIFGGTFDPPHFGHMILAAEAQYQLELDLLLFVLTPDPPHKRHRKLTPVEDRKDMLAAAIDDYPGFKISTVDIDRPGPHYTIDTMRLLRQQYPEAVLIYLMGGDSLEGLLVDWYRAGEFIKMCDEIGVMRRPNDELDIAPLEKEFPNIYQKLRFVEAPLLEISSRQIRERVHTDRPYCFYLPEAVRKVIDENGIYIQPDEPNE